MGQGLQTTYSQLVAEALGVDIDKIDVIQGDTDLATGIGSVGSRSLFVGGTATVVSTQDLIAKAREKASNMLEASIEDIDYVRRVAHCCRHRQAHQPVRDRAKPRRAPGLSVDSTGRG